MKTMQENQVPLYITDIPYSVVNRKSNGLRALDKGAADNETFHLDEFVNLLVKVVSGSHYIFCATEQVSIIRKLFIEAGLTTRLCIWEKTNPSPMNGQHLWLSSVETFVFARKPGATFNEHCKSPVFRFPIPRKTGHPTPKPIELCKRLILASSLPSDTVFDPCLGGGNIGVAAITVGRKFLGTEICPKYFEVAKTNLERAVICANGSHTPGTINTDIKFPSHQQA